MTGLGSSPLFASLAMLLHPACSLLLWVLFALATATTGVLGSIAAAATVTAGPFLGSRIATASRHRLARNWRQIELALVELLVGLKIFK